MNIKRIGVFTASLLSGVAAYAVLASVPPAPAIAPTMSAAPSAAVPDPGPQTVDLLVAARDIPMGAKLTNDDIRWSTTIEGSHAASAIVRRSGDDAAALEAGVVGSVARQAVFAGEAISRQRLVTGKGSLMAYTLPPGKRAVAVDIDARGGRSAGNFILPGDRVDVLFVDATSVGATAKPATTLLRDIRVLAVGPHQGSDSIGGSTVQGETVTLEVDPAQAERISGAGVGTIKLALRPQSDAGQTYAGATAQITTVRYGIARQQ